MIELLLENAEFAARKPDLVSNFKSKLVSRTDLGIEEKVVDIQYMREGEDKQTWTTHENLLGQNNKGPRPASSQLHAMSQCSSCE